MFSKYDTYLEIFVNNLNSILQTNNVQNNDFLSVCSISPAFFYNIKKLDNASFSCYVKISEALSMPLQILFRDLFHDEMLITGIVSKDYTVEKAFNSLINNRNNIKVMLAQISEEKLCRATDIYLNFCVENIKKILAYKKLSQSKLAKNIGVTQAYLNNIINRKQIPSIYVMIDIAEFLEIPLFDLLNAPEKQQLGVPENYKRCLFRVTSII